MDFIGAKYIFNSWRLRQKQSLAAALQTLLVVFTSIQQNKIAHCAFVCICAGRSSIARTMWLQRSRWIFNLHLTASLGTGCSCTQRPQLATVFHSQRQPGTSRKGHMKELFGSHATSRAVSKPHDLSSSEDEEAAESSDSQDEIESNSDAHVRRRQRIHFDVTDLQRLYHLPLKTVRGWAGGRGT